MSFFTNIWLRATSPAHYKSLVQKSFWSASGYLILLLTLAAYVTFTPHAAEWHQKIPTISQHVVPHLQIAADLYPRELIVSIEDGQLSINQPEPYFIPMPKEWQPFFEEASEESGERSEQILNLVAIDTNAVAEQYAEYNSIVLLTKHSAVMPDKNNKLALHPFSKIQTNFVVDRAKYDKCIEVILPYFDYIEPFSRVLLWILVLFGPWIYSATVILWYWLYALLVALILWVGVKIAWGDAPYGKIVVLSLYGMALPILVWTVLYFLVGSIPYVFSLILIFWMVVVLNAVRSNLLSRSFQDYSQLN